VIKQKHILLSNNILYI